MEIISKDNFIKAKNQDKAHMPLNLAQNTLVNGLKKNIPDMGK